MGKAPYAFWQPSQIAEATNCPEVAVRMHWPILTASLEARGIDDCPVQLAAIATVAIETASTFAPVREAFWLSEDWRRANLRYYPWYGRGFVQLTWESNYQAAGDALGVDLTTDPDRALEPRIAADVLAWYFEQNGVPAAARRGDWTTVRRLVQGGADGLDRLVQIVNALGGSVTMPVTFNPDEPNIAQNDPWSCAPTSARWSLKSVGRNPSEQWIEDTMQAEGVVSMQDGLLDASGAGLAAFLKRQYGEFGFDSNNEPSVSFDWCAAEGDHAYPVMIGGRGWNHWCALKGFDPNTGRLLIMNPSPGWMGVQHTMDRPTFNALGPFSAVRLWHPDLLVPLPPPPPDPHADLRARVRAVLENAVAQIDALLAET